MHGELLIIAVIIVGYMYSYEYCNIIHKEKMNTILYSCLMHIYGCVATVVVVDGLGISGEKSQWCAQQQF